MKKRIIIVGISGPSGSGKSLLANTIVKELGSNQVAIISEDSYYKDYPHLSYEERAKLNYDHPNAFDHALLYEHLKQLQTGKAVDTPVYDHKLHARKTETQKITKHTIIVLEGILLFYEPMIRDMMDIRIFMDTPADICLLRRLKRDIIERQRSVESVLKQYEDNVRPMYLTFIEPSKQYAHIIVPEGGENRVAIDMIKAKLKELLNR